jgi:hypothetical protein
MSEVPSAPVAPAAPAPIVAPAPVVELNPSDAARALAARRVELRKQTAPVIASAPEAEPEPQELAPEANADPVEAPSEPTEVVEPAELPPIDPPRSWTQAEKERFQSLPRETQEYLHTREQEREREFRRGQNETAEQRKAIEAEQTKARELQQKYEAKLAQVMQTIQETGPFSDIRSMADLEKLQVEDPFRFQAYQLHQWKLQATQAELSEAETRKAQEQHSQWAQHVQKENELAAEYIPELADKEKGPKLTQRVAQELLPELGFKDSELNDLASGKAKLSIYDHRVQRLLADALKLRDIKSAPKAVPQALPPVQRPGVSKPAANSNAGKIQALESKLNNQSGFNQARLMAEIRQLRRAR